MLVGGEAGVGKTALVQRFCDEQGGAARVLWGACDALFTPRPLGPLLDIARATEDGLGELIASGAKPYEVADLLMRELLAKMPTILGLEDMHWADEATLDVLRLLGRRVEAVPALVLATYRDDGLDRSHPLRIVLGELATAASVDRIGLAPLSPAAVAVLADPHGVDPDELYRRTAGNPFFVTEVLAAGDAQVPSTVRDAVLARTARLSPAAVSLLEAAAVVPPQAELWLLQALAGEVAERLDECLASGVLMPVPGAVAFRHELARLAVEESLAPHRRAALHRAALAALVDSGTGEADAARLAHHAEGAGDAEMVLRFAPAAGVRAAALGAHREAAAQYARALRFAEGLAPGAWAELFERYAYECYLTGRFDEALDAQEHALALRVAAGDPVKEGDCLRSLSRLLRFVGRTVEAAGAGRKAVALLEELPAGHELAMAHANLSHICVTAEDAEGTLEWGGRARELAERLDDAEVLVYALTNIGAIEFMTGTPGGTEKLERSVQLAQDAGLEEPAGRALLNLVWWPIRQRSYPLARRYLEIGLAYCGERGLDLWRLFLLACRARIELDEGRWAEAGETAAFVLRDPRTWPVPRIFALATLALVRARQGDPWVWPPLDESWSLAQPSGELQRIAPAAAARAEAAWLEGDHDAVAAATEEALELALRRKASWVIGELACWRRRAGIVEDAPTDVAEPYALQLAGEWAPVAERWTELGCPYEAALALADADEEEPLRRALAELQRLGARPAAAIVARRLRERGARGLPRGPRPATRQNPANLSPRELEVLALLTEGLRNKEIAERLVLADKTVDHHVGAILRKLGVRTRTQAIREAARLGLPGQDR